jgi:hypothetical protein
VYLYGGQKLPSVSPIVIHEDYVHGVLGSDVALLQLAEPVHCSADVKPVKLASGNLEASQKNQCWVTGWGDVHFFGTCWGSWRKFRLGDQNLPFKNDWWVGGAEILGDRFQKNKRGLFLFIYLFGGTGL